MKEEDIRDDEIVYLGKLVPSPEPEQKPDGKGKKVLAVLLAVACVLLLALIVVLVKDFKTIETKVDYVDEKLSSYSDNNTRNDVGQMPATLIENEVDTCATSIEAAFTQLLDTVVNGETLHLYIPHNATMTLQVGAPDESDSSIVYIAQAADIRADNGEIVGAFVLRGEQVSRGGSKAGYCAIIEGRVYVGVSEESNPPLLEEAIESKGYFFRQYPLVENGLYINNRPKGVAIRRALCERNGEIFMVQSAHRVEINKFARLLDNMGVDNAIYLVGSSAFGWAVDLDGVRHEFGERGMSYENINYIVWR